VRSLLAGTRTSVRGDAHRRRKVTLLSIAGGDASEKTAIVVSPLIALMPGSGCAARSNGNFGRAVE